MSTSAPSPTHDAAAPCRLGLVGLGKIATDQHLPVIAATPAFRLAAIASQRGLTAPGVVGVRTLTEMLDRVPDLDAVVICTPPRARHALARQALLAGLHVMLEKPPTATLAELADLRAIAARRQRVLFTTWHSQYNAAVTEAARLLRGQRVSELLVEWKEDVRKWHPGQAWIWQAGGFGVFDPGINALSIVTAILPDPVFVREAVLSVPANADSPIAASLDFTAADDAESLRAEFDWRQTGGEVWQMTIRTAAGQHLFLSHGGRRLEVDGVLAVDQPPAEYEAIYRHFAALLGDGVSHIDEAPLRLVADAFLLGRRTVVEAFEDP